ncbi:hypothetical protein EII34_15080 [Arachnia propionica]|uniref:Uncharacterized protein n=1 Tax=Arachnia propionica TaxID=1750 RepID=A0A3P1T322_9ACTN|nr:hypothetical protein [Arachnia propionica]RRD03226.1 hypothetical protein EII34_15080 [Arachnia propionica]
MARKKTKLTWNFPGFKALRTHPKMMADLQARAERIADKAGPGFKAAGAGITGGRGRGRVAVVATTQNANRKNAREHTLLRSLDAGGDDGV